jgi:hypothetical protein
MLFMRRRGREPVHFMPELPANAPYAGIRIRAIFFPHIPAVIILKIQLFLHFQC